MTLEAAIALALTLVHGTIHAIIRAADPAHGEGHRIHFVGGAKGEHSIDVEVSSPERVMAHWEGYLSAQPGARAATCRCKAHRSPRPPVRYAVVVEGAAWQHDGWSGEMADGVVGWTTVEAVSPCEVRGLVRAGVALIEWEQDGNVRLTRTREFEVAPS